MQHTPEPWTDFGCHIRIYEEIRGIGHCHGFRMTLADWDRAKSCVNALAGITDPAAFMAVVIELLATLDGKIIPQWPEIEASRQRVVAMLPTLRDNVKDVE